MANMNINFNKKMKENLAEKFRSRDIKKKKKSLSAKLMATPVSEEHDGSNTAPFQSDILTYSTRYHLPHVCR